MPRLRPPPCSGEVDLWEQPALDLLPLLKRNADVRIRKLTDLSNQTMLRPNSLYPPFNDPRARLALATSSTKRTSWPPASVIRIIGSSADLISSVAARMTRQQEPKT